MTKVVFDADQTSYVDLCKLFFEIHDPAQTDGQGPDIGPQYRSEIFYLNEEQKKQAEEVIALLRSKGYEVNTRLTPASAFWEGEEYHQHYYDKTGGEPYCHIRTKKFWDTEDTVLKINPQRLRAFTGFDTESLGIFILIRLCQYMEASPQA